MGQPFDMAYGWWARFSRYEVRDGYIRPAAGAELIVYDPWTDYRAARESRGEVAPPYQSLMDLVQHLALRPARHGGHAVDAASERRIAAWCAEHGLLGAVLQAAHEVRFAPRWEPYRLEDGRYDGILPADALHKVQRVLTRQGGVWASRRSVELAFEVRGDGTVVYVPPDDPRRGQLLAAADTPKGWPQPGIRWAPLTGHAGVRDDELSWYWSRFFPDVPEAEAETFRYFGPGQPQFWRMYAEPVSDFIDAALLLRDGLQGLGSADGAADGQWQLNALVAAVSPAIGVRADGTVYQAWVAPSLLASFAMMALQDITGGRKVRACDKCGTIFTSAAWQARYCSERCRRAAQQRAYRQRKRER